MPVILATALTITLRSTFKLGCVGVLGYVTACKLLRNLLVASTFVCAYYVILRLLLHYGSSVEIENFTRLLPSTLHAFSACIARSGFLSGFFFATITQLSQVIRSNGVIGTHYSVCRFEKWWRIIKSDYTVLQERLRLQQTCFQAVYVHNCVYSYALVGICCTFQRAQLRLTFVQAMQISPTRTPTFESSPRSLRHHLFFRLGSLANSIVRHVWGTCLRPWGLLGESRGALDIDPLAMNGWK